MKIEQHLSNLLYLHDCIIVPGFGAFITNTVRSTFDTKTNTFLPPHKEVSFNPSLNKSDGLLTNAVSYTENITFSEANHKISEQIEFWKQHLQSGKVLVLDQIGTLKQDEFEKLEFQPETKTNYLVKSFGLSPIKAKYVLQPETVLTSSKNMLGSGIFAVASLIPIVIGGYLYFNTPAPLKNFVDKQWSGFVVPMLKNNTPSHENEEVSFDTAKTIQPAVEKKKIEPSSPTSEKVDKIAVVLTEPTSIKTTKNTEKIDDRITEKAKKEVKERNYNVIAGVYTRMLEANELKQSLESMNYKNIRITPKTGKFIYVIFDSFDNKKEAEVYARELREFYPETWVKKTK